MARAETPIFTRTYDFLTWLLPVSNSFPRAHRHTFTRRLLNAAFDLRERLEGANVRQHAGRIERLSLADEALARVCPGNTVGLRKAILRDAWSRDS